MQRGFGRTELIEKPSEEVLKKIGGAISELLLRFWISRQTGRALLSARTLVRPSPDAL